MTTLCCSSREEQVEAAARRPRGPMQNSRASARPVQQHTQTQGYAASTASSALTQEQQQKLREKYSSPMRPSQYTRSPHGGAATETETPRQEAERRERERLSLEQVLLDRRWAIHSASPLFHFHREELSEYAHELVKALRAAALRACGQQFGYSVSIRNTDAFVAFQIREERDRRHRRSVSQGSTQPKPNSGFAFQGEYVTGTTRQERQEAPERSGGFVLYFPEKGEQRAPRKGREPQQVLLLRGNEELLRWVCSWLQRRFQCVVNTHVVRIQQLNLKRLARNWAVASLLDQAAKQAASALPEELTRQVRGDVDAETEGAEQWRERDSSPASPPRAPLLLQFRATHDKDLVRCYTLTVPWATLRRLFEQSQGRDGGVPGRPPAHIPELIEQVERLYFDSLPFDLSTYELQSVAMQEVAVDLDGGIEFYSMALVHTVLFSLMELLAVQDVSTAARPEMTL